MTTIAQRRSSALLLILALLLLAVGVSPGTGTAAASTMDADVDAHPVDLAYINGFGRAAKGSLKRFPLSVPYDATVQLTTTWDSRADVGVTLLDASGAAVAAAPAGSNPAVITADVAAGDYKVAVKVKTRKARYAVDVDATYPDPIAVYEGSGTQELGRWKTYPLTLDRASELRVVGDWVGDADVNLYLRTPAGDRLVSANTVDARPEMLAYSAPAGEYVVAALVKTGSASYRVEVYDSEHAPDHLLGDVPPMPEEPTDPTDPSDPPIDPKTDLGAYVAQPLEGSVYWGAVVGSNSDPYDRHEGPTGTTMGLRRTFFQWRHRTGYMVDTAREDLAKGRLPWVSAKTPSWAAMARGDHDAEIDEMLRALDALDGPVWLTLHHEPDGGGGVNQPDDPAGPSGHLAMNRQVRARMTALETDNIALAPILMTWTWDSRSGRNPDAWWGDGVYDFLGVDHYVRTESTLLDSRWPDVREWAAARNVDIAVGEWGVQGTDEAAGRHVREWYEAAVASHDDGGGARVVGLTSYDKQHDPSQLDWELRGEQLVVFHELMRDQRTAHLND